MAEIALTIVQLIESAHTRCNLLYNSPVVRQILWQLRTASLCDRVVQQVVPQPHTRYDYRYNCRIDLNRPADCTTDRTVCEPLKALCSKIKLNIQNKTRMKSNTPASRKGCRITRRTGTNEPKESVAQPHCSSTPKIERASVPERWLETARSSETSVNFYRITQCHIPEDRTLHAHLCKNLKPEFSS
jgi:hypothetical protein